MLITRLLLWTAAAGAWDRDDHQWVDLLSESLQTLSAAALPPQAEPQVASLAAVALSVLRSQAPRYLHSEETMAFDRAAAAVAHLLAATDLDYVEEYTRLLEPAFGSAVSAETVEAVAGDVVQNDPVQDAMWALLDELDRDVHRHGDGLLHVVGSFGNPRLIALEAVGAAQDADLVGALGRIPQRQVGAVHLAATEPVHSRARRRRPRPVAAPPIDRLRHPKRAGTREDAGGRHSGPARPFRQPVSGGRRRTRRTRVGLTGTSCPLRRLTGLRRDPAAERACGAAVRPGMAG